MMIQIGAIQILRAVAALMVVLSHAQNDALFQATKTSTLFARCEWLPWDSGVDLFFVISGFIMVHASQRLFATPHAGIAFFSRRLVRIVPLYWMITAIGLVILAYAVWEGKRQFPSISEITASLGFVPFARPEDGQPRPIVALGWTLNYEMFFYVVFALFIRFERVAAVVAVGTALALAATIGAIARPTATTLAYWSDPIVLEFVLGMFTALIWESGFRLKRSFVVALFVIGLAVLALDIDSMTHVGPVAPDPNGFGRLIGAGVPMTIIFAAVVLAEPRFSTRSRLASFFALVGDASYALYLFHPLVIIFARKAYLSLGLAKVIGFWPLILADIPTAVAFAILIHFTVEKPMSATLRRWFFVKQAKNQQPVQIGEVRTR
jgi:peptidoglycan/LPS O-acetylase OafA/YrhL